MCCHCQSVLGSIAEHIVGSLPATNVFTQEHPMVREQIHFVIKQGELFSSITRDIFDAVSFHSICATLSICTPSIPETNDS